MAQIEIYCRNLNRTFSVEGGTTLLEIAVDLEKELGFKPLCAHVNNKLEGLRFALYNPKQVSFLGMNDAAGMRVCIRSLCMLLFKAIKTLRPELTLRIEHSIAKGYYCRLFHGDTVFSVTQPLLDAISHMMQVDIGANLSFIPNEIPRQEAIEIFRSENLKAKVTLFNTRHELYTNVYSLDNIVDSYYGPLLPSTGYITAFGLALFKEGFLLLGPDPVNPECPMQPIVSEKMFEAFTEHLTFNKIIGVRNIGQLNDTILAGHSSQLINVAEALHAKKISAIANEITRRHEQGGAKIVLLAGPSSSGKTTTTHRLAIYLLTNLLSPVMISLDNYFVNRDDTPLDENGEKDYEHINALDLKLFNDHLQQLLEGHEIEMPYYNFELGRREYRGDRIKLRENDVLLIEGIHGLNPVLTAGIAPELKFRIYVSALTTLSIDDHNWIPTSDNRLLRRIIRDYKYRGTSAIETIKRWPSVKRGEEKWIFPYQENADAMFNSSLLFELAVMKDFAEKILKDVPNDCVEYAEAYRLRKFLNYFESITPELVPPTSLLREFLGGSSINY